MNNNSTLSYFGKINIKFKVNDRLIYINTHNTGCSALFSSLANYLAGNIINSGELGDSRLALIPSTLDIRIGENINNSVSFLKEEASIPITRIDASKTNSDHTSVLYEATISYNYLSRAYDSERDSDSNFFLCLYSNEDRNNTRQRLAYLDFNRSYMSLIQPGTQAILTWTLEISNQPSA